MQVVLLIFTRSSFQSCGRILIDITCVLLVRTRWVDYKDQEYSPYVIPKCQYQSLLPSYSHVFTTASCQIDPGWHAWMSYLVDKPPTEDALLRTQQRAWELPEHRPNPTQTRAAYKPYSTYVHICQFDSLISRILSTTLHDKGLANMMDI